MTLAASAPAHTAVFEGRCMPATQPGATPGQGIWRLAAGAILELVEITDRSCGCLRPRGK